MSKNFYIVSQCGLTITRQETVTIRPDMFDTVVWFETLAEAEEEALMRMEETIHNAKLQMKTIKEKRKGFSL